MERPLRQAEDATSLAAVKRKRVIGITCREFDFSLRLWCCTQCGGVASERIDMFLRSIMLCALALSGSLLAGCATVRSRPDSNYQAHYEAAGLTYFLPTRMLRFTGTRTPLDPQELADAKTKQEEKVTKLQGDANTAQALVRALETRLAALPATTTAATRAEVQGELDIARANLTTANTKLEEARTLLRQIIASLAAVESGAACSYTARLEALPPQPDPNQRFIARLSHNVFRDDTLRLSVNASGLLSSANIVAVDRTADIIVEAAGAIGGLGVRHRGPRGEALRGVDCTSLPRQFVRIFDPLEGWPPGDRASSETTALSALTDLNRDLAQEGYPFRLEADISALRVSATAAQMPPARGSRRAGRARSSESAYYLQTEGAIYYRSAAPVTFTVQQEAPGATAAGGQNSAPQDATDPGGNNPPASHWYSIDAAVVMLPQAGPITYIPMNSSAFVRTVNDVQFTDGSITSWTAERPSEALEIVRLPVKVLTALVSVPAQLLSVQVDISSRERTLLENQRLQIEQQQRLVILRECIAAAERNETSPLACIE